jgi:hypothetical protein
MLSFIYNLANNFESSHGMRPNLLYINPSHLQHLQAGFAADYDLFRIMSMLEMEFIIDNDIVHPRVAWTHLPTKTAICQ